MKASVAPRLYVDRALAAGERFDLPEAQSRHVQVLRLQPEAALTLFNGAGGEWRARILQMGRSAVGVQVEAHVAVERELARRVTLAIGMPANERMDTLIEKATELGAAAIQPLLCERSVLRLAGERAARRLAHWRGVATAASEQSGRTRLPQLLEVRTLHDWLIEADEAQPRDARRFVLSLAAELPWGRAAAGPRAGALVFLSGPEGGLAPAEEDAARAAGFVPVSLGARVLRADTAPLAVLAWCSLESLAEQPV
jgi:16S rRNA (uracil1498-N3)-methyltransferase